MTITMKALDSFYADDTKHIHGKTEFTVATESRAEQLEKLGLAKRISGEKAAPASANKMAPAPANKRKPAGRTAQA